jgi:hypothetical protein
MARALRAYRRRPLTASLVVVGAALALGVAILGVVVFVTRDEDNIQVDNLLAERFTREVALAEARGEDVDLRRLAPFAWDRVLIVAPGTPREAISRRLGRDWTGTIGFQTSELLILLDRGEVARFLDYRGEGRFAGIRRPFEELPRERAVFRVRGLVITPA